MSPICSCDTFTTLFRSITILFGSDNTFQNISMFILNVEILSIPCIIIIDLNNVTLSTGCQNFKHYYLHFYMDFEAPKHVQNGFAIVVNSICTYNHVDVVYKSRSTIPFFYVNSILGIFYHNSSTSVLCDLLTQLSGPKVKFWNVIEGPCLKLAIQKMLWKLNTKSGCKPSTLVSQHFVTKACAPILVCDLLRTAKKRL